MRRLPRRNFLHLLAAQPAWLLAAQRLSPSQLGANTAITGWSLADSIDLLRKIGFPVIEIHPMGSPGATPGQFPGFRFDELTDTPKKSIKESLRGFRHVTAHLPYTGLDYFAADRSAASAATRVVDTALEGSAYFGAELAVLHPKPGSGQTLASQWPLMIEGFRRWGDMAQRRRMRIALETGFPLSIADFVRLIKEVNHPAVGATIDVGHQGRYAELTARVKPEDRATPAGIRAYNDTTLAIIEGLGPKTFHLHVHDIDPATWQEHRPLGTGFVDYDRLFTLLRRIRYRGFLIFEIAGKAEEMEGHLRSGKASLEARLSSN